MAEPLTGVRIRRLVTPGQSSAAGTAGVWLPWLVAPVFMAAPMGGCALADRWRPPAAAAPSRTAADARPAVPDGAVVTVARP
ncbi:MAG: hypothetical protein EBR28_11680 [Planctomycetia bacterium]|nr:hypothetical protein [Planctomycetia bacterium]